MGKLLTATDLRKNLYSILKHIDETPIFFTYKGKKYSILSESESTPHNERYESMRRDIMTRNCSSLHQACY